jgi:biotin synthase-related radical SAM superfamily protein
MVGCLVKRTVRLPQTNGDVVTCVLDLELHTHGEMGEVLVDGELSVLENVAADETGELVDEEVSSVAKEENRLALLLLAGELFQCNHPSGVRKYTRFTGS